MINDLIAFLVVTFLVEPLQSEVMERLDATRAPQQVVQDITACVSSATPVLVQRAAGDPWWALSTSVGVWTGNRSAEMVLREATPGCEAALRAARPFLGGGRTPA